MITFTQLLLRYEQLFDELRLLSHPTTIHLIQEIFLCNLSLLNSKLAIFTFSEIQIVNCTVENWMLCKCAEVGDADYAMVLGIDSPVHSSLVFHSHAAVSSFLAAQLVLASVQSLKYFPVTFSSSGSTARRIDVCAPEIAVLKTRWRNGSMKILKILFLIEESSCNCKE